MPNVVGSTLTAGPRYESSLVFSDIGCPDRTCGHNGILAKAAAWLAFSVPAYWWARMVAAHSPIFFFMKISLGPGSRSLQMMQTYNTIHDSPMVTISGGQFLRMLSTVVWLGLPAAELPPEEDEGMNTQQHRMT